MRLWQQALFSVVLAGVFVTAQAADIEIKSGGVAAGWSYTFTDNISNAGEYYSSTPDSPSDASTISVTNLDSSFAYWKVQAKRITSGTDTNVSIYITRTGDGTSSDGNTISGPSGSILLNGSKTIFCGSGTSNRTDVPLQFQVSDLRAENITDVSGDYGTLHLPIEYTIIPNTTPENCT